MDTPATKIARFASLLFSGLFAGFLVAILILELSLRKFDASTYTQVRLVELDSLDKLAAATLIPALIATTTIVILAVRTRAHVPRLPLTALILLLLVLATTLAINMPINADQLTWSVQTPPPDWATDRDHWQLAHALRTAASVLAFACLTAATRPKPSPTTTTPPTRAETPASHLG